MAIASDLIISSDSHVMEPVDLWKNGVPEKYREAAPLFPPHQAESDIKTISKKIILKEEESQ